MQIIEDAPIMSLTDSSSMDDIRNLVVDGKAPEQVAEEVAEPEVKAEPEVSTPEPQAETEESDEPELPKGVQKRIEKEVERAAAVQRRIDEAVSARKAKEAELAKLTGTGSDPVKTPQTDEDSEPVEPDFATFEGTGEEFAAELKAFKAKYRTWAQTQTEKTVESKFQERQQRQAAQDRWDSAVAEYGDKLEPSVKTVAETAPEHMQVAISALDNWSKVAVHLAANPAELTALADQFKAHPPGSPGFFKAVAQLGRLEAQITTNAPKADAKPALKVVPAPLKRITADPGEGASHFDPDKADMSQVRSFMQKSKLL
jgi:chemotaxis protein histidine kinase CheA